MRLFVHAGNINPTVYVFEDVADPLVLKWRLQHH